MGSDNPKRVRIKSTQRENDTREYIQLFVIFNFFNFLTIKNIYNTERERGETTALAAISPILLSAF